MSRLRILYGMLLLIGGLAAYSLAVMALAVRILPDSGWAEFPYYLVAGTIWIYPAARLTRWMQDLPDPRLER